MRRSELPIFPRFCSFNINVILTLFFTALTASVFLPQLLAAPNTLQGQSEIVKITQNTPSSLLRTIPDTALVELSNGKQVKMGKIRKTAELSIKLKNARSSYKPIAKLKFQPAAQGIQVNTLSEIKSAMNMADSETIQLPNGQLVTVELLKFIQPELEKKLGAPLSTFSEQSQHIGNALKIQKNANKTYWQGILAKPSETILESPGGKRVTVGELKLYLPDQIQN